jgi:flagellar motility protein MotE (MotC chaperone)
MPKCEFTKDFESLIDDFNVGSQRAIAALNDNPKKPEAEPVDEDDIFNASLEQVLERTKRDFRNFDDEYKDLEAKRKEHEKQMRERNQAAAQGHVSNANLPSAEEVNAGLIKHFATASERLEKSLEGFTLRIRSQLVGRKDLGEKFTRAANTLFLGLKKLDGEVDKFAATELKRQPKEQKELEVMPSKFLADFKGILKKHEPESENPKLEKALKDAEDRLKRIDTNHTFDRVTTVCEGGQAALREVMKNLGKEDGKLTTALKELVAAIEKYDNHMFLLSRMR